YYAIAADPGWIPAGKAETPRGDAAIRFVIDAAIFGAIDKVDAVAAHAAAVAAETATVGGVRAGEIEKRILHLDAFDVADARRRDIHMAAGVDAIAMRRCAHAGTVDIIEPLR